MENKVQNYGKWAPVLPKQKKKKRLFLHEGISNFQYEEESSSDFSEPDCFLKHIIISLIMITHFSLKSLLQAFPERENTVFQLWDQKKSRTFPPYHSLPQTSLSLQKTPEWICRKKKTNPKIREEYKVTTISFLDGKMTYGFIIPCDFTESLGTFKGHQRFQMMWCKNTHALLDYSENNLFCIFWKGYRPILKGMGYRNQEVVYKA